MVDAGVDEVAVETFAHYYRLLEHGETGMIPESAIEPLDMESLADLEVDEKVAADAIRTTASTIFWRAWFKPGLPMLRS